MLIHLCWHWKRDGGAKTMGPLYISFGCLGLILVVSSIELKWLCCACCIPCCCSASAVPPTGPVTAEEEEEGRIYRVPESAVTAVPMYEAPPVQDSIAMPVQGVVMGGGGGDVSALNPKLESFLGRLGLTECAAALAEAGVDCPEDLDEWTEDELVKEGLKRGHVKKIMKALAPPPSVAESIALPEKAMQQHSRMGAAEEIDPQQAEQPQPQQLQGQQQITATQQHNRMGAAEEIDPQQAEQLQGQQQITATQQHTT
jgi:hypothetical protein